MVDTSVWSLALRRDSRVDLPEVRVLLEALAEGGLVVTTGLVLQELLQGFAGPRARAHIIDHFSDLPMLAPTRDDHVQAAEARNLCRRSGLQVGTIDALLMQLCLHHQLTMLTADRDFHQAARVLPLQVWQA